MDHSTMRLIATLIATVVFTNQAFGAGACCLKGGGCVQLPTEQACIIAGGVFLNGEDCRTSPCAAGACCSEISCVHIAAHPCITSGRDFMGAGTQCADDPCGIVIGACCFGSSCELLGGTECSARGGKFVGAGTNCGSGHCVSGSCCLGTSCQDINQFECGLKKGAFFPGEACDKKSCLPPDQCPDNSLFSQSPEPPTAFLAGTSEEAADLRRWENFSGVAGAITALTWWGLDMEPLGGSTFEKCAEQDPTFRISFHVDANGVPGPEVCSYTLLVTRTPTGILYIGSELNQYDVTLPSSCVITNGWVSIVGLGDPDCWFLWMSAAIGDSFCDNCNPPAQDIDLAVCLQGDVGGVFGSCCDDFDGSCKDGVEITDCLGTSQRFSVNATCDQLNPPCGTILGECCFPNATCEVMLEVDCGKGGGTWLGPNALCSSCPCIAPCPPGGIPEGEEICDTDDIDVFNGGCTSPGMHFSPAKLGQLICGTSGIFKSGTDELADFDWYEIEIESAGVLHWDVTAEFVPIGAIRSTTGGCPGVSLFQAITEECDALNLFAPVTPGTYWLVVRPFAFTDSAACGARYFAIATLDLTGDLNRDGVVDGIDLGILLVGWNAPGGGIADLNGDGTVNGVDLGILLANWTL